MKPYSEVKKCPVCSAEFTTHRSTKVYCSPGCRAKANQRAWSSAPLLW